MSQSRTTELLEQSYNKYGAKRITGTSAVTPDTGKVFIAIQAEEDTVINTTTGNITGFDGAKIATEGVRYGRFTSITLTSGKVIAYMGV